MVKDMDKKVSNLLKQYARTILPDSIKKILNRAISLYKKFISFLCRRSFSRNYLRGIRRNSRNSCWCGGEISPFRWHNSYATCQRCGTYVNRYPPCQSELERLYSFDLYWHVKQRADGLPHIKERTAHDRADGRVAYWIELIKKYGPPEGRVIEIGCAHGVLLRELKELGYDCIGVDVDQKTVNWTSKMMSLDVRAGFFPGVELPRCDLFLAIDVFEHSIDPEVFMREAARLLNPGGIAMIQTVIDRFDYKKPFSPRFKDAFDDVEHLFIYTDQAMCELSKRANLQVISLSERIWLMGEIGVFKKA